MRFIFISLAVEKNPEGFKTTVLGSKATRHDLFGVAFESREEADTHQEAFEKDERGGIMLASANVLSS